MSPRFLFYSQLSVEERKKKLGSAAEGNPNAETRENQGLREDNQGIMLKKWAVESRTEGGR